MAQYLVHGEGFAEVEEAPDAAAAIRQFRRLAQEVNPEEDGSKWVLTAEAVSDLGDTGWKAEIVNQHRMAFGLTDEFN